MCGQQRNSPMADPIFGSKYGPQNGVQNWITFSFLLLGLCLGPVLGSRFGPKSGVSHRRILLLPAEILQADFWRTSMSASVNTCFFSLCVPLCFLYSSNRTWDAQREKGMSWHSCSSWRVAQICLHNMCGQQRNSPMADPIFGSKYGPQNGVQNWITFSFLLLGLCLGPVLGSRFGPKSGVSHRRILLLPAEVLQADFWRTSMSASVNTCFFSLCVPLCFLYILLMQCHTVWQTTWRKPWRRWTEKKAWHLAFGVGSAWLALGPVWDSALYTMLRVLFRCSSFLHWGIHHWCDPDSPQDAARAACAPLLGPCCFLPPVLAAFPGALSPVAAGLFPLVLFSFVASFARFAAFVCCGLFVAPLLWPFVVFVGFVFVWCSWSGLPCFLFVCFVGLVGCACCPLTKVTKDY